MVNNGGAAASEVSVVVFLEFCDELQLINTETMLRQINELTLFLFNKNGSIFLEY
jgi:hypothetical protein